MGDTISKIQIHPSSPPRRISTPAGFTRVALSVGTDEEAIQLYAPQDRTTDVFGRTDAGFNFASFPKTRTEIAYDAIFVKSSASGSAALELKRITATFPKLQLLPSGEVLLVAARCQRFKDETHEMNAKVYDGSGCVAREFLLGDGVNHVQTDTEGNIWVGYSDEGVYGNFGWQDPVGVWGLSCFTGGGQKVWDFKAPHGFDPISDCYALNVCRDVVWAYYYTEFPFARIDGHRNVRCWENKARPRGGHAFAIADQLILLYGGYDSLRTACRLFTLSDNGVEQIAEVQLIFPREVDLSRSVVIGRHDKLHVFSGDDWYLFSFEAVSCALT